LGSANDKGDINNTGAYLNGCIFSVFADRTAINGDAALGFWAFKSPVSTNSDGTFSGTHTEGDLLLISHFTNGGGQVSIEEYMWHNGALTHVGTSNQAYVNDAVYGDNETWAFSYNYKSKFGPANQYPIGSFFEGQVDLCALYGTSGVCFASFMAETRNSQQITAADQDFALGDFTTTLDAPTVAVTEPSLCGSATACVEVTSPKVSGYTYYLSQETGGATPSPITYSGTGDIKFCDLVAGKKFSVYYKNAAGCASGVTDCDNYQSSTSAAKSPLSIKASGIQSNSSVSIVAVPNPYGDNVKFTLQTDVSGQGTLELYNMLGQKVKTVFQGYVEKGKGQVIEYKVPTAQRSGMTYLFRVGDKKTTGKLIGLK
jgi:hypothetical protein